MTEPQPPSSRQLAAAQDLALLAACNHTITSYGSFSFWASFLAGGGWLI